jgi:hypothetical protein
MADGNESKPDLEHLEWAIDQRAKIQHTLLALYKFVRDNSPDQLDLVKRSLLDDLIAAAFSLWRAVFLAESNREWTSIHKGQEDFLARVITNNAINYLDDKRNRAWTVSYYLENAKHRLRSAHHNADHHMPQETLSRVPPLLNVKGTDKASLTRYEWESVHMALRIILKILYPHLTLPVESPALPHE